MKDSRYVQTRQNDKQLKEHGIGTRTSTRTSNHPEYESYNEEASEQNRAYGKRRRTDQHLVDLIMNAQACERREAIGDAQAICHFSIMGTCQRGNRCKWHHITDVEKKWVEDYFQRRNLQSSSSDTSNQRGQRGSSSNWRWSDTSRTQSSRWVSR